MHTYSPSLGLFHMHHFRFSRISVRSSTASLCFTNTLQSYYSTIHLPVQVLNPFLCLAILLSEALAYKDEANRFCTNLEYSIEKSSAMYHNT